MWTTLALAAAVTLAPGQASLELTNVRPTYGLLGAPRPDAKFLPGDMLWLAFDIEGIKVDDSGNVLYNMSLEATDAKGNVKFSHDGSKEKIQAVNALGGSRLPAVANLDIGLDMPAGKYEMKVTVNDLNGKKKAELKRPFEVLPPAFGLVRLTTTTGGSEDQVPAPLVGVVGQQFNFNFVIVGFERDKNKKQPQIAMEMTIIDDATKKPTLAKPFTGEVPNLNVKDVPANLRALPQQFGLVLNRPGKFTFEIKVTDKVSGKTATASFPLTSLANDGKK